jgi:hypothetical protein
MNLQRQQQHMARLHDKGNARVPGSAFAERQPSARSSAAHDLLPLRIQFVKLSAVGKESSLCVVPSLADLGDREESHVRK